MKEKASQENIISALKWNIKEKDKANKVIAGQTHDKLEALIEDHTKLFCENRILRDEIARLRRARREENNYLITRNRCLTRKIKELI